LIIDYWNLNEINKKRRTRNKKPQNGQIVEWLRRLAEPGTGGMFIEYRSAFPPAPFQPDGGADFRIKHDFGYWLLIFGHLFLQILFTNVK